MCLYSFYFNIDETNTVERIIQETRLLNNAIGSDRYELEEILGSENWRTLAESSTDETVKTIYKRMIGFEMSLTKLLNTQVTTIKNDGGLENGK